MGPPYFTYLFSYPQDGLKFSQKSFEFGMHPQLIIVISLPFLHLLVIYIYIYIYIYFNLIFLIKKISLQQ